MFQEYVERGMDRQLLADLKTCIRENNADGATDIACRLFRSFEAHSFIPEASCHLYGERMFRIIYKALSMPEPPKPLLTPELQHAHDHVMQHCPRIKIPPGTKMYRISTGDTSPHEAWFSISAFNLTSIIAWKIHGGVLHRDNIDAYDVTIWEATHDLELVWFNEAFDENDLSAVFGIPYDEIGLGQLFCELRVGDGWVSHKPLTNITTSATEFMLCGTGLGKVVGVQKLSIPFFHDLLTSQGPSTNEDVFALYAR